MIHVPDVKQCARAEAPHRRPVVAVVGSGTRADRAADEIDSLIARLGCHLLTGAGGGNIEAISRAFYETPHRPGLVIGVVPGAIEPSRAPAELHSGRPTQYSPKSGYPNKWVEIPLFTHPPDTGHNGRLPTSRNHIIVLSASAIVALPGGAGTQSEMWLATRYGVPIIAYGEREELPAGGRHARTIDEVRHFLSESCLTPSGRTA
jgi:predicted Rossmann-fold nucleotide-binding protein